MKLPRTAAALRGAIALAWLAGAAAAGAADWRAEMVPTPGPVTAVEQAGEGARIALGAQWYRLAADGRTLEGVAPPPRLTAPADALPDARVAVGADTVARAWLATPTGRYRHGVLGDAIEAGSLEIERRDGTRATVRLGQEAVFEDIEPRIVRLDGAERIIVVKSYLDRGAALAIVDPVAATIIAETPAIGRPHAWVNPAGVADFDGDGMAEIAVVRQPHVVGRLELWRWHAGVLERSGELPDVANHVIGSRALAMSRVADLDGDGRPDLVIPSLDRRALRLIGFGPAPREIARVAVPARLVTDLGLIELAGRPALVAGLETGALVVVRGD